MNTIPDTLHIDSKLISLFMFFFIFPIILVVALGQGRYGVLEKGEYFDYSLNITTKMQISLLSFQGPIKLAKVNQDNTLNDINPEPGTYFFYDFPENISVTYRVYGSSGGATYPQYKFDSKMLSYWDNKRYQQCTIPQANQLEVYQNQSIKFRSEQGYLIISIPLILFKNQTFIGSDVFHVILGQKQDAEVLKLLANDIYEDYKMLPKKSKRFSYPMKYDNYETTLYVQIDPEADFNYFSVGDFQLLLGGYEFQPHFQTSHTWIWMTLTLFIILSGLVFWITRKILLSKEINEDQVQELNYRS